MGLGFGFSLHWLLLWHLRPIGGGMAFQGEEWIAQRTCPLWTLSMEGLACSPAGVSETTVDQLFLHLLSPVLSSPLLPCQNPPEVLRQPLPKNASSTSIIQMDQSRDYSLLIPRTAIPGTVGNHKGHPVPCHGCLASSLVLRHRWVQSTKSPEPSGLRNSSRGEVRKFGLSLTFSGLNLDLYTDMLVTP